MTIRIDQIADAIVAVPGVTIEMLIKVPVSPAVYTTVSPTFVQIDAAMDGSFTIPVAGTYQIVMVLQVYATGAGTFGRFRINLDGGTYLGNDDSSWGLNLNTGVRTGRTFVTTAHLTAGLHTISPEWERSYAAGAVAIDSLDYLQVWGTLVSGSGAGGVIPTSAELSVDASAVSSAHPSFADIAGLSVPITTCANETVLVSLSGWGLEGGTLGDAMVQLVVDSTVIPASPADRLVGRTGQYAAPLGFTRVVTIATAGSHTIKIQGAYGTNQWIPKAGMKLDVLQFRGGLVPIRQDGVDKVGTPRALDFIGAGVYEVTEGTGSDAGVAKIQLNQALTTPGASVEMLTKIAGVQTISAASPAPFEKFTGIDETFVAPVAGDYDVDLFIINLYAGGSVLVYYRCVFDVLGTPQYVGGADNYSTIWTTGGIRSQGSIRGKVTLTAGTHTVEVQGLSATGPSFQTDTWTAFRVVGTLVSGSGAGGTIVTRTPDSGGSIQTISSVDPSFTDIAGMSVAITTSQDECVAVDGMVGVLRDAGATVASLQVLIDSTAVWTDRNYNASWDDMTIAFTSSPLTAGSHTIKLQGAVSAGSMKVYGPGAAANVLTRLQVTQFRGGLVPIRKDGVSITDTPAAFNFAGSGWQVTNVGGTANITATGRTARVIDPLFFSNTGLMTFSFAALGSYSIGNAFACRTTNSKILGASFRTMKAGAHTVRCIIFKAHYTLPSWILDSLVGSVDVACSGPGVYTGYLTTPYAVLPAEVINQDFVVMMWETSGTGDTEAVQCFTNSSLPIGKSYFAWNPSIWYVAGEAEVGDSLTIITTKCFPIDPIIECDGDPGYVQAENVPILEYSSTTVVNVKAGPGAVPELRVTLNDGQIYTYTGTLTFNITVAGLGGRDTGAESDGFWYLYLVPSATAGQLAVVGSITAPITGPTGYTTRRYIGAIRNYTDITKFKQTGNEFYYASRVECTDSIALGTAFKDPKITLTLVDVIPKTASHMLANGKIQHAAAAGWAHVMALFVDGETSAYSECWADTSGYIHADQWVSIPTPTTPKQIGYRSYNNGGAGGVYSQHVYTMGWIDGYLSGLPSQLQAKYTADTIEPQILWRGISRIDVQAAPGQPSTVLLTLQDAKQRSLTTALVWNPSTGVIDGGLDTGVEAISSWYYLYMVPQTGADDSLHVRGSLSAPPTGPAGYTNWRYIGAVRNDNSGNFIKFFQVGSEFYYIGNIQPATIAALTKTNYYDPAVEYSIADVVPVTAGAAQFHVMTQQGASAGAGSGIELHPGGDVDTSTSGPTPSVSAQVYAFTGNAAWNPISADTWIQTKGAVKTIGYRVFAISGGAPVSHWAKCGAWRDGYLGSAVGLGAGGLIGNTLNGAYDSGGAGSGRIITVDAGVVEMNAAGGAALKLDGYLTLAEISSPTRLVNKGQVYSKDVGGYTEFFYMDNFGTSIQITSNGYLVSDTLNGAYDSGGAGAGRIITVDAGVVEMNAAGGAALKLDGYLTLAEISAPTALVNKGQVYSKDVGGYTEFFYMDNFGTSIQITSNGCLISDTLNGAYDSGGAGAGRIITVDAGVVEMNAAGGAALKLDGYLVLTEISSPTRLANKGQVYSQDVGGYTELFYMDDLGTPIQFTSNGELISNTLNQAYDEGGAGAGRIITVDAGVVEMNAAGGAALKLDGYLTLEEISAPTALVNKGQVYSQDVDGFTEFFYMDNFGTSIQITSNGYLVSDTLNGAYDSGGAGAGRIITVDAGVVEMNASGGAALKLDGYLTLAEISSPTALVNKGQVYSQDVDGFAEFFYMDNFGTSIQITSNGYLISDTLNGAYDSGGAGAGRIITVDAGVVEMNAAGGAALKLDGYLTLAEISTPTALTNKGQIYSQDIDGYTELVYMDNFGTSTQITSDGYLDTLASVRGVGMFAQSTDPVAATGKGVLYSKDIDGYTELVYMDNFGLTSQMTTRGVISGKFGPVKDITQNYYPNWWEYVCVGNTGEGTAEIFLPVADDDHIGQQITITAIATSSILITPDGTDDFRDLSLTSGFPVDGGTMVLICLGIRGGLGTWDVLSRFTVISQE
jgi:hypothetical protein